MLPRQGLKSQTARNGRGWLRVALVFLALGYASVGQIGHARAEAFPTDAIGRLIVDDSAVCTAFVARSVERQARSPFREIATVYENWLVSAGHCHGQELVYWDRHGPHPVARVLGFSAGGDSGHDVLVATFVTLQPVPTLELAFGEYPRVGDKLMLIGYGRSALMTRVGPLVEVDERGFMAIENFASPGNSGGPVLIPGTRRVVGIGVATTVDIPVGFPASVCRLGVCSARPPYFAVHIDRIRGIASFR